MFSNAIDGGPRKGDYSKNPTVNWSAVAMILVSTVIAVAATYFLCNQGLTTNVVWQQGVCNYFGNIYGIVALAGIKRMFTLISAPQHDHNTDVATQIAVLLSAPLTLPLILGVKLYTVLRGWDVSMGSIEARLPLLDDFLPLAADEQI